MEARMDHLGAEEALVRLAEDPQARPAASCFCWLG
jgi:hypothetical protein